MDYAKGALYLQLSALWVPQKEEVEKWLLSLPVDAQ